MLRTLPTLLVLLLCATGCAGDGDGDTDTQGDCAGGGGSVPDLCDGVDDDCDGQVDEDAETLTFYTDGDGDGYGADASAQTGCEAPTATVTVGGDCDDGDADVSPDADERCGGADEDCDGLEGDDDPGVIGKSDWYIDEDGDGFGDGPAYRLCDGGEGYVDNADDCDDGDASLTQPTDWFQDADGDGYGGGALLSACGQPEGYVTDTTDCDDGDAEISPGLPEVCLDGKDNDCDETDNGCLPLEGAYAITDAGATITGSSTYFGLQLRHGDTDGDGAEELITSAPYEGGSYGAVFTFEGIDDGDAISSSAATGLVSGSSSVYYLGFNIGYAHDVDGDGYDDLLAFSCSTYLVGLIEGPIAAGDSADRIGTALSGIDACGNVNRRSLDGADLDGDGYASLLIGAPYAYASSDAPYSGAVYVVDNPAEGTTALDDVARAVVRGESAYGYLGSDVSTLGDLDGDGVLELAFGAYTNSDYNSYGGAVGVLSGDGAGSYTLADVDRQIYGSYSGQYAGYDVSDAGDVDGDGRSDLILSAYYDASFTGSSVGAAYVYLAPIRSSVLETSSADVAFYGTWESLRFAQQLAGPLDMNGDDVGDIALADPLYASSTGLTSLYYGPFSLGSFADTEADATLVGTTTNSYSSYDIAGVGDLNSDGYDELAANVYGTTSVNIFFGGTL